MASAVPLHETELTAGAYLRLRREASGLSVHDVAVACTSSPVGIPAAIAAIEEAEQDRADLQWADLRRLRQIFSLEPNIYLAIAQGLSVGGVCRGCGCSEEDACQDGRTGCAWTDATRSFCTACREKSL